MGWFSQRREEYQPLKPIISAAEVIHHRKTEEHKEAESAALKRLQGTAPQYSSRRVGETEEDFIRAAAPK